jgi:hypothetical protein
MCNSYWNDIENMIFDLDINEPDQQKFNKQPKNVYSYIKSQKKENTRTAPLRSDGVLHADPTEKANILNRQFQSAFSSEANTEIPDKGPSTHPIMKNISISKKGILKLINNINPKKAVGPDNFAGKILKENADICSDILTINYKQSVETWQVPLDWNHTNVTPVKGRQTPPSKLQANISNLYFLQTARTCNG